MDIYSILKLPVSLLELEKDIFLNRTITNISPSNMYEIIFTSKNFVFVEKNILDHIKKITNKKFDVYVKNFWGYVQDKIDVSFVSINKTKIKEGIITQPNYSFVLPIKGSFQILLKNKIEEQLIFVSPGEACVFNTENFIEHIGEIENRIAIIGSISDNLLKEKNVSLI